MDIYFAEELAESETTGARWLKKSGAAIVLLLLLIGVAMMLKSFMSGSTGNKKRATTINIVVPEAPPPPPPPKEQPKEQPKEIRMEQPKPQEVPQARTESLKMEGAAGAGDSPFAAGSVNNDYIGGKPDMSAFAWYTGQVTTRIEEALAAQKELAKAQYRLILYIWLAADGTVERAELQGSSGDQMIDKLINKALAEIGALAEAPPRDMPQPVKLRITSKNTF